jgi:hypothetical protein
MDHVTTPVIARLFLERFDIRRVCEFVVYNRDVPENLALRPYRKKVKTVLVRSDDGCSWCLHSKDTALNLLLKRVLSFLLSHLEDSDVRRELLEVHRMPLMKLDNICKQVEDAFYSRDEFMKRWSVDLMAMLDDPRNNEAATSIERSPDP